MRGSSGPLAERARSGEMRLNEAISSYRAHVHSRAKGYRILDRLQTALNVLPDPLFATFARLVSSRGVLRYPIRGYWNLASPDLLTAVRTPDPLPMTAVPA
ncbi:MAG: hypothetical protein NT143_01690 [Actinobacteria bacterium]|nr:hypothetical protein [Actinomycetota bacterium]